MRKIKKSELKVLGSESKTEDEKETEADNLQKLIQLQNKRPSKHDLKLGFFGRSKFSKSGINKKINFN